MALAVALWLLISVVPGLAVLRLLRVPCSLPTAAVMAPPVSFGLMYLIGLLATRANASTQTLCFVLGAVVVAAWLVVEAFGLRRDRGAGLTAWWTGWLASWRDPRLAVARGLLVVGMLAGAAIWTIVQARILVPAGWDAMHHGYFVRQIVEHHTLRPEVVLSSDPNQADGTTGFYPLAANLAAALINVASGAKISTILLASTVALSGILLPAGIYAMVRRIAPDHAILAGLAAIAAVLPARLYTIVYTGRITVVLGMALVPAAVALLLLFGRRVDWRLAIIAPLAAIGLVGVHSSELPIALVVALPVVVVAAAHERAWRGLAVWFAYLVGIGAFTGLLVYLIDPTIVHVVSERSGAFGSATGQGLHLSTALFRTVVVSAPFPAHNSQPMAMFSVLAMIGSIITVHPRLRALRTIAAGYLLWALFYFLWLWGHLGPVAKAADLWYRSTERMLWEFTVLGAVPVGIALYAAGALVHAAALRLRSHGPRVLESRRSYSIVGALAGAGVVLVLLGFTTPPAGTDSRWLKTYASPVSRDSQRAFAYLAAHVGPRELVLDDLENHGDLWMYVDNGVPTVFGNPPLIGGATASWKDRLYLRGQLKHIATDPCVGRLLRQYDVAYVFYSKAKMWGGKPKFTLRVLENTKYFRPVFSAGGVHVFQVIAPDPDPASCTRNTTLQYPWSTLANSN